MVTSVAFSITRRKGNLQKGLNFLKNCVIEIHLYVEPDFI